ncbi:hypothetical protein GCM10007874_24700 [Labrys miyagiensis]|uniref:DUF2147 domain-containing protein n=1 Tax=Labrys miyagiensis TaxID=346912 RepID=A0ABQ6CGP1_9HYPH|nr:lipocalin family protein [Labrys miyagiensis]GLS19453.1 hypothetical protein GCM10007874_24700 [Labrys miyagiensis]
MGTPLIARLETQRAPIRLRAILVCVAASIVTTPTAWGKTEGTKSIVGSWVWNRKNLSPEDQRITTGFTFKADGTMEAMEWSKDGIGPNMGEGLGDEGHYRLRGDQLTITSSSDPQTGWPIWRAGHRVRYHCRVRFAANASSFHLSQCAISGEWLRQKNSFP